MPGDAALRLQPLTETFNADVSLEGRDRLSLRMEVRDGEIVSARLTGSGCPDLLKALQEMRPKLQGAIADLELPKGSGHSEILMRELFLKALGQWNYPYDEEELCHCRAVPTAKVDQAIVGGCHTASAVAKQTSAGTSCGTCRPNTEKIIAYRLGKTTLGGR